MSQGQGGGRPTKYKAAYVKQVKQLAKLGATDFEIAQFLEIAASTFKRWCAEHPKFSAAIRLGKVPANRRAERSLYARANGYTYEAEEIFLIDKVIETPNADPKAPPVITRSKEVLRVPVVKHIPPDTGALAFWLKNRERDRWRDKHDHELTGKGGKPIGIDVGSAPDLLQAYYARLQAIADEQRSDAEPAAEQEVDGIEGSDDL